MIENEYMKPEQVVAELPWLTKGGLAQMRYRGIGPKFLKPTPRSVFYRRADVIAWLEANEMQSTRDRADGR